MHPLADEDIFSNAGCYQDSAWNSEKGSGESHVGLCDNLGTSHVSPLPPTSAIYERRLFKVVEELWQVQSFLAVNAKLGMDCAARC